MKRFLLHTSFFLILVILSVLLLLSRVDNYTDPFYYKFTTPKQSSLILGSSKASLGLIPSVFNEEISVEMFNYAFTIGSSPYGPSYLNSVKKKVDKRTQNGVFIVTVDPWSVSCFKKNHDDVNKYRELIGPVGETEMVNLNPNVVYAFNGGDNLFKKIIKGEIKKIINKESSLYLHNDGWLEIFIPKDSIQEKERTDKAIEKLRNRELTQYRFSKIRLNYLSELVNYLQIYGEVYLIRLPVADEVERIENQFMRDFDAYMEKVAMDNNSIYLNMNKNKEVYKYTDGVHLHKESAKKVSKKIANWIKSN